MPPLRAPVGANKLDQSAERVQAKITKTLFHRHGIEKKF